MGKKCLVAWLLLELLAAVNLAIAQNGGTIAPPPATNSPRGRRPWIVIGGPNRRDEADETDDLKDFNHALAVQASREQVSAYNSMLKASETAGKELQAFQERLRKKMDVAELSSGSHVLREAVENASTEAKQFVEAFSKTQQSGLRDITAKLTKADSDLAQQANRLEQKTADPNPDISEISGYAKNLDQALTNLRDQQLNLGKEMGIDQDITFNLAPATSSIDVGGQPISISVSGTMVKAAADEGQSVFKLELTTDLSGLQQSVTDILRSRIDRSERCGERHAVRWAELTAQSPASIVVTQLHLERWGCFVVYGQETSNELAEGDGTLTVKLMPILEQNSGLQLAAEVSRVEADGWAGDLLRSDELGTKLRDEIRDALRSAIATAANFRAIVPEVAQDSTTINKAEFYEAGGLHLVLDGTVRISDQQIKPLANQPKDNLATQGALQQ